MRPRHTTGDWQAVQINRSHWQVRALGTLVVAECPGADAEGNARLIAAAPGLLDACNVARSLLERVQYRDQAGEPITTFAAEYHARQLRAAIAVAKGHPA